MWNCWWEGICKARTAYHCMERSTAVKCCMSHCCINIDEKRPAQGNLDIASYSFHIRTFIKKIWCWNGSVGLWDVMPCSLLDVYWHFSETAASSHPVGRVSRFLWNATTHLDGSSLLHILLQLHSLVWISWYYPFKAYNLDYQNGAVSHQAHNKNGPRMGCIHLII